MANNRLYLRCNACGKKLFLGKSFLMGYYWKNYDKDGKHLEDKLNEFYDEHTYCEGGYDDGDFSLEYESPIYDGGYIRREDALSFPYANGEYDKENANQDFIQGCESYKEWLEGLPAVEIKNVPDTNVGDTISRQAVIDALGERPLVWDEWADEYVLGQRNQYDSDKLAIETVPSAERHGRWLDVKPAPYNLSYATCSVCGNRQTLEVANYCPMCGAEMRDEVTEE